MTAERRWATLSPAVFRFAQGVPLDVTVWPDPGIEDRSGPPLSQGVLFTMLGMVAGEHLAPAQLDLLSGLDPNAWYHGQLLETMLQALETRDPSLPRSVGRSVYLLLRARLEGLALHSPSDVIAHLGPMWPHVTRGDTGEIRSTLLGRQHAQVELQQPFNCRFEEGTIVGFVESHGGADLVVAHDTCMRRGAPSCVLDLRWRE